MYYKENNSRKLAHIKRIKIKYKYFNKKNLSWHQYNFIEEYFKCYIIIITCKKNKYNLNWFTMKCLLLSVNF